MVGGGAGVPPAPPPFPYGPVNINSLFFIDKFTKYK